VRPTVEQCDQELAALARETRRVAATIREPAVRNRLIEIAEETLDLARSMQNSR
jgi:hypothetical protein